MDKIAKALKKLTEKERDWIKSILLILNSDRANSLDIKKLKNRNDIFRVRKGKMRILYRIDERGNIIVLKISRRNEKTYKI